MNDRNEKGQFLKSLQKPKSGIYIITSLINGKVYIGQSINIKERFVTHKRNLRNNKHSNIHFQLSYNKYNSENFTYNIIEYCDLSNIDDRETYWINFYDARNRIYGFNIQEGGHANRNVLLETKVKITISLKNKGKIITEETRKKLSKARLGVKLSPEWCNNIRLSRIGKKSSDESKLKMSIARRGKKNPNLGRRKGTYKSKLKDVKHTVTERLNFINAYNNRKEEDKLVITQNMIDDVIINEISRRKFDAKYLSIGIWEIIRDIYYTKKKTLSIEELIKTSITQEMINDVLIGITRHNFALKYTISEQIWRHIRKVNNIVRTVTKK